MVLESNGYGVALICGLPLDPLAGSMCVVTLLLYCCYTVVILVLHCSYTVFTLLCDCGHSVVTLLLHCDAHKCGLPLDPHA
jgi:hypothetical protein